MLPNEINLTIVFLVSETYNNETNQEGGKEKKCKKKNNSTKEKNLMVRIFLIKQNLMSRVVVVLTT